MPFLIFGSCGLIGCAFSLILPETLKKKLPETIKEAEKINIFG
jgi:hypothetical protein